MNFPDEIRNQGLTCAREIADWLVAVQSPARDDSSSAGSYPWVINKDGTEKQANNWNVAFAAMGLLSAFKAFAEPAYETAALNMGRYLKSLQIFDPFKPDMYGSFREMGPQCPWNYTRDTLSVAWAFIELYRHTCEVEYLERARLWANWFVEHGLDEEGWPYWGFVFEPCFEGQNRKMHNHIQGSFQGGSLNFLYHLARETDEPKWIDQVFVSMADHFVTHIQQDDGFFRSVLRATKRVPDDPQGGLHRANDDVGTLGLLCAHQVTGNDAYLVAINKFLKAVFTVQRDGGALEDGVASIPVVLNVIHEAGDRIDASLFSEEKLKASISVLYAQQSDGKDNSRMRGGIIEDLNGDYVCGRSSCYALIVLLKLFAGVADYLTIGIT